MKHFKNLVLVITALPVVNTFDYAIVGTGEITLTDVKTSISGFSTIFTDEVVGVSVNGVEWAVAESPGTDTLLNYQILANGAVLSAGNMVVDFVDGAPPSSLDVGTIIVSKRGSTEIEVAFSADGFSQSSSGNYEAYAAGWAIIPLLFIMVLAMTTHMVEFSLFSGVFVGACMVAGNIEDGFKSTLDVYILNAVADIWHGYVYLFSFFLSGLVAMLEKSGGMQGFIEAVSRKAKSSKSGQLVCFFVGVAIFFDDYANCLLVGKSLRPLMDSLFVSREKLSFLVDSTAAPIASIAPVSSWVGYEIGLIQDEIDKIIAIEGTDDIGIKTTGLSVFLESVKYRYYPIFMLFFIFISISLGKEAGNMLIAERRTQVYKRSDGGDAASNTKYDKMTNDNKPREDTPKRWWNMVAPILLLVFFVFYLIVKTGEIDGEDQSFMDKVENGDSYAALLWGTMSTAVITLLFYLVQIVRGRKLIIPDFDAVIDIVSRKETNEGEGEDRARFLMSPKESVDSFMIGVVRVFPALVVLTLSWASASIMGSVGTDRLFGGWIVGNIDAKMLPTLTFIISMVLAFATGTSWGTMAIMFPLVLVPTYISSNGDEEIFYSVVAGVLSGSVAGDHISPISDTTVLSSLACDCNHIAHVGSQIPYAIFIIVISILLGTLPIGYSAWPNIVGLLLGIALIASTIFFVFAPVISPSGSFDLLTELYIKVRPDPALIQLKNDTAKAFKGEGSSENVQETNDDDELDMKENDDEVVE